MPHESATVIISLRFEHITVLIDRYVFGISGSVSCHPYMYEYSNPFTKLHSFHLCYEAFALPRHSSISLYALRALRIFCPWMIGPRSTNNLMYSLKVEQDAS